ncbi:MAG: phosphatase PAP2 family protein [Gammaproteobacteria bacterium]
MSRSSRFVGTVALLGLVLTALPLRAQTKDAQDEGPVRRWGADAKAYVTAPFHAERKQWVKFGSTVAAIAFAYQHDDDVRAHFVPEGAPLSTTHDSHSAKDALPAALALGGTWLGARLSGAPDGRREAGTMFEAAVFSSVATELLKQAAGRERPWIAGDRSGFRGGGDSFPSMHVSAAFAIGTVLAESGNDRQRWLRRILGYGIGTITAYERMKHDEHWLSDTVAGAGVGIATARFMVKRHDAPNNNRAFAIVPTRDGLAVTYAAILR